MLSSISEQTFGEDVLGSPIPVLVHFSAPWCGICRLITPSLAQFQTDWQHRVRVVEINADESLKLANQYRLKTLPTLLWFREGKLLHRLDGFRGRDGLGKTLVKIIENQPPSTPVTSVFNLTVCKDIN